MKTMHEPLREGRILNDRYQIERHLGAQDAGFVCLCRDLGAGKARVRVRILGEDALTRGAGSLSRKLSLLRRLRHPGLVRILDYGVLDGSGELFLVQEWADGTDLSSGIEGMDPPEVLGLVLEVSKALHYLHTHSIVHGALNPSRVVLIEGGEKREIKLLDFGLECRLAGPAAGDANRILAYIAPEVLMGGPLTEGSDLYSLGVLIYQLLARRLPFDDEDPGFLIQKQLQVSVDLRPIERLKNGPEISQLLWALLDKDPSKRPASGEVVVRLAGEAPGQECPGVEISELESFFSASLFVGRKNEMQLLQERAARVRAGGRGWTVFVTGEAGSGKTRCLEELRSWALLEGWRVVEGACSTREDGSYGPYRQILAKMPTDGKAIFHFNDVPRMAESGTFDASSEFAAGQFRDLLTRELVRRLTKRPTLLLLHDFHLADKATNTVLDYLSSDIQAHPVLMCVSLRSGEEARGALSRVMELAIRQERGEVLALEPLTKGNVEQLVAGMTGDSALKETLGNWMFGSIGGNPFFLEEMLKHLVEQGLLRRGFAGWRFMDQDLPKLEIPASVGVVLQRRLVQLPPPAGELAKWLALFHRPVSRDLLSSVAGWKAADFSDALQELSRRQMIRFETEDADENVAFCHSLIAEVIRGGLPQKLRRSMHRRIAEALEREYGAEGHLQELAMHHMEGRTGSIAVRHALALASQSRSEFAHENALHCFRYVFEKRGDLSQEELCQAAIEASDTMFALGLPKRAIHLLKSEMRRNRKIGVELKTRMLMQLAMSYQHLGDFRMQEACCRQGLRCFGRHHDGKANLTKAMLWAELAFIATLQSKARRGLVFLNKALRSCPDSSTGSLAGRLQILAAYIHRVACNVHEALAASEKAANILSRCQESYLTCSAYSTLGIILMGLGRLPLALEKHNQAVSMSEKSRSVIFRSQALGNMAECLCRMGRIREAIDTAECGIKRVSESNNPAITFAFNTILAEIRFAAGDYSSATKMLKQLERNPIHSSGLYVLGHIRYVAASMSFTLGDFDASLNHIHRLSRGQTREAPFYESELAEALKARILFERGAFQKAIRKLYSLNNQVAKKRWPYQMCIIKLHLAEVLIKRRMLDEAERFARGSLRLAKGMQSVSLLAHGHLLMGLIHSAADLPHDRRSPQLDRALKELQSACALADSSFPNDTVWRAHAELCFLFRALSDRDRSLEHAEKAYGYLCKLESRVPSEMLAAYSSAFDRHRLKAELVQVIEAGEQKRYRGAAFEQIEDDDRNRILLRVSNAVNTIVDVNQLLEEILDQLIRAIGVERAFVLLRDESAGDLHLAKGRNNRQESLSETELSMESVFDEVCEQGRPIVSADARNDPRLGGNSEVTGKLGKLLCAPLRVSGRILGVLYADHSSPAESLNESVINLFAAFCNMAAIAIDNSLAHQQLVREKSELEQYLHQVRDGYVEIIGKSAAVEALRDRIGLAAASPLDILITGESGTGKELVARAIHRTGRRKGGKFLPVDCGSLSDSLAESELFGYRKGAFTGASENRQGLLEAAQGGIIFLDEIANLPFRLQAKLLRVLQEREVRRIGETSGRNIDIQVIAATNKDLLEEMRVGRFRRDLYYRLKAMEIRLPPLRDRSEDIPLLIEWYLEKTVQSEDGRVRRFSQKAKELLKSYHYPGNVRELKNIVASSYYSAKGTVMDVAELPPEVHRTGAVETGSESAAAERLYLSLIEGRGSFEELIKEPFLNHELGASLVRGVIQRALKDSGGKYRDAFARLRIPDRRYSVTIQFLKRNKCYLDFRPFRRLRGDSGGQADV